MVKNEIYKDENKLFLSDKKNINQINLPSNIAKLGERHKSFKNLEGKLESIKKIRRIKSAGIF